MHRDSTNAFNEINRETVIDEVPANIPVTLRYTVWSLSNNSSIFYADNVQKAILSHSKQGRSPQGGAPSSPMLFQLEQNKAIKATLDKYPKYHVADDGYLKDQYIQSYPSTQPWAQPSVT